MNCRHCGHPVAVPFIDLGSAPYSNAYLTQPLIQAPEKWYPLRVITCPHCWLAQTDEMSDRSELFSADYAYFTSYAATALTHAAQYVDTIVERLQLDSRSRVVEVASNDGYLLQYMVARGIPSLGIEPTASTARVARERGVDVIEEFFGVELAGRLAASHGPADLMIANNVLAHVPDINDFAAGFAGLLAPAGVATFEFPHLLRMVRDNLFDMIYHEHYSYLSLTSAAHVLEHNGLQVFDVEEVSTHGGSLRIYAQRRDTGTRPVTPAVAAWLRDETDAGMATAAFYESFQSRVDRAKDDFVLFLIQAKREGKRVAAYGAAAKANTLMNYAGIRGDLIPFIVDRNPAKQGRYMPGSRIPIAGEDRLRAERPDYVVIFAWNLREEIAAQLSYVREWGGRFVTAIPRLDVW